MKLDFNTVISERPAEGGCIHESDELAIGWRTFAAGEEFAAHYHEHFEEVFICVTGNLVVVIDDVVHELAPGDRLVVERRHVHSLSNRTSEPSEICYLKVPFVADDTVWVDTA